MPEYLSPGVYVEEVETGAMAIEGVSTSTAGFLGQTERGPVDPQFITSFAEFKRQFGDLTKYQKGGPLEGTNLAYAVNGFFRNGGSRCYVGRVTAATESADVSLGAYDADQAVTAEVDDVSFGTVVEGQTASTIVEFGHDGIENDPPIEVSDISVVAAAGGDTPGEFTTRVRDGSQTPITLAPGDSIAVVATYKPTGASDHAATIRVAHDGAEAPTDIRLTGTGETSAKAATLATDTAALDYGTIPKDTAFTRSVTVIHDGLEGADSIAIDDVTLEEPEASDDKTPYTITNKGDFSFPITLSVGDRVTFDVDVDHDTAETVAAAVQVDYDGTETESVRVRADVVDPANTLGGSLTTVDFGELVTDTSASETVVVRNMGGSSDDTLTVTGLAVSDTTVGFEAAFPDGTPPFDLAPGESTTIDVGFTALSTAKEKEEIDVTYEDAGGTEHHLLIDLVGDGRTVEGDYHSEPPADDGLDFDDVVVGESTTRSVVLSNAAVAGATPVEIGRVELANDPDDEYAIPDDLEPPGPGQPVATLAAGETLEIPVTVTPSGTGLVDAALQVDYANGTSGTDTFALTATGVDPQMAVEAVGPGAWGGRIAVTVRNGARTNDAFSVTIRYWSDMTDPDGTDADVVAAQDDPDVEEIFSELATSQDSRNYYEQVITDGSNLVQVDRVGSERPANGTTLLEVPPDPEANQEVGLTHYTGSEQAPRGERTGLAGFAEIDDLSIVSIPDENSVDGLTGALVSHCENKADRFAVLQSARGDEPDDLPPDTAISEYAAVYYPHIEILDPQTGVRKLVPPGGHVAGIYARSDAEHGVWKAPANETIRGVVDLEFPITKADQARLNPKGVNAIRSFPGRGIRVWGARTTSANPQWKYVNVRRLFLYIEESIDEGTQWAVFESNTEQLWARVRQSVRNFLTTVWRNGGLAGTNPEEAFYVKADRTTMTQTDIDNGKLIVEIGVAPVKPAEFVIFRITQWTEGVEGGS